jgi:single-strand DNA-binding protein
MANDINVVTIIGNLTRDVDLRATQNGKHVANFSIANNRTFSGEKQTSYFNCIAWGKTGELLNQYCQKGSKVAITGRLQQRTWEDKDGKKNYAVEIVAESIQFLTMKPGETEAPCAPSPSSEDIPF